MYNLLFESVENFAAVVITVRSPWARADARPKVSIISVRTNAYAGRGILSDSKTRYSEFDGLVQPGNSIFKINRMKMYYNGSHTKLV